MKRLLIVLVAVGAMLFASPATAKKPEKPPKPPTDPPPVLMICDFNAETGALQSWQGLEGDDRTCIWRVEDPSRTVRFHIESPDNTVTTVGLPHLIVNEGIVFPSEQCFKPWPRHTSSTFDVWTGTSKPSRPRSVQRSPQLTRR